MVNNGEYCVETSDRGQPCDKIHTDLSEGERFGFSGDTVKWGSSGMSDGFVLLTSRTSLDVIRDPLFHSRPLGAFACLSKGFVSSRMSGGGVIVVNGH